MPDWLTLSLRAIIGFFDFINPWSKRWAEKANAKDKRKEAANVRMQEGEKKGDWDEIDRARADSDNA